MKNDFYLFACLETLNAQQHGMKWKWRDLKDLLVTVIIVVTKDFNKVMKFDLKNNNSFNMLAFL